MGNRVTYSANNLNYQTTQLSIADLAMFSALDFFASTRIMNEGFGDVHDDLLKSLAACNLLTSHHRRIKAIPKIAHYIKTRPQEYPF